MSSTYDDHDIGDKEQVDRATSDADLAATLWAAQAEADKAMRAAVAAQTRLQAVASAFADVESLGSTGLQPSPVQQQEQGRPEAKEKQQEQYSRMAAHELASSLGLGPGFRLKPAVGRFKDRANVSVVLGVLRSKGVVECSRLRKAFNSTPDWVLGTLGQPTSLGLTLLRRARPPRRRD